jgi:acyl-CoA thioester hydrolase
MVFEYLIRTRYSETGQDGIIHHSSYAVYLEVARIECLRTLGCDINELEKKQLLCPVIDLSLQYLKPIRSLEDIVVQVAVSSFSKIRFCLAYRILRETTLMATARVSHCFLNESFKPIPISDEIIAQLQIQLADSPSWATKQNKLALSLTHR